MNLRLRGREWERTAESFLQRHGLKTLRRNYHCRHGEVDLVMRDKDCVVFVEVRFRRRRCFGSGAETVSRIKQSKIARTAAMFLGRNRRLASLPCRFDVISVGEQQGQVRIDWIRNAFEAGPNLA